jgi:DNA-binding MarR family transcriptional regulator
MAGKREGCATVQSQVAQGNDVAEEILRTIRQLIRRVSEHSKFLSREAGLTLPQLICLKAIGELEDQSTDVTVAQVSDRVQLSPATVSRIIDRLETSSLVSRERSRVDRRRVSLTLTPGGYERFQTLPIPLQETFVRRLSALPEPERLRLLAALRRIAELMEASDIDAAPMLTPEGDVKNEPPLGD